MANLEGRAVLTFSCVMKLTEAEAGALDALVGYGIEPFLEAFYAKLGRAYLEPYEAGLRSLFASIRTGEASVQSLLTKARDARAVFEGKKIAKNLDRGTP